MTKIEWLKPGKSDKGPIILHINGRFNLSLWSKENLDEWMFMINESIERHKMRRSCLVHNSAQIQRASINTRTPLAAATQADGGDGGDLYENTAAVCDAGKQVVVGSELMIANGFVPPKAFAQDNSSILMSGEQKDRLQAIGKHSKNMSCPLPDTPAKPR